jgi:hypothetical protein
MKLLEKMLVRIFIIDMIFWASMIIQVWAAEGPVIHIDPITHAFPAVFEGETLSHGFIVSNRGSAELEIKDVTHQ